MGNRHTHTHQLAPDDDIESQEVVNFNEPRAEQSRPDEKREKFNALAILQNVKALAEKLDLAVDEYCRKAIDMTNYYSQNTNHQIGVVLGWIFTEADAGLKDAAANFDQVKTMLADVGDQGKEVGGKQDRTNRYLETLRADIDILMARDAADGALSQLLEERSRGQSVRNTSPPPKKRKERKKKKTPKNLRHNQRIPSRQC